MIEHDDILQIHSNGYWTCRIPGLALTPHDIVLAGCETRTATTISPPWLSVNHCA
jgi:hypothetical protein